MNTQQASHHSTSYRPDIDGLRAVAVLSVIIFHIEESLLPGGFIGVDIFFVISGFLISGNLFREKAAGTFSFAEFYRRRVKRILPALAVVVLTTLIAAQLVLIPEDAQAVAHSSIWSIFSMANLYFWLFLDTGYFAAASNEIPLLHLWSLGVEEQFYIIWPVVIYFLYSAKNRWLFLATMALAFIGSFIYGELSYADDPSYAYYMLPTRMGELLGGAAVAYIVQNARWRIAPVFALMMGLAGLLLLAVALAVLSEEHPYPGWRALIPTLGAALIILSGSFERTAVSRWLAGKPLVAVGLISYSAYLWHWPILAFYRYGEFDITLKSGLAIFLLTLVLAYLTYRFVEQPTRRVKLSGQDVFRYQFVAPVAAVAVIAVAVILTNGLGVRIGSEHTVAAFDLEKHKLEQVSDDNYKHKACLKYRLSSLDIKNKDCTVGEAKSKSPKVLLWGDSNAAQYSGLMLSFANHLGFKFNSLLIAACPPLLDDPSAFVVGRNAKDCHHSLKLARPQIDKHDIIVMAASWSDYQRQSDTFLAELYEDIAELELQGKKILLLGKISDKKQHSLTCDQKAISFPFMQCNREPTEIKPEIVELNADLKAFANASPNVEYFGINGHLCPDNGCPTYDHSGLPLFRNSNHVFIYTSYTIGEQILNSSGIPASIKRVMKHSK